MKKAAQWFMLMVAMLPLVSCASLSSPEPISPPKSAPPVVDDRAIQGEVQKILDTFAQEKAADERTAIFNVVGETVGGVVHLSGRITPNLTAPLISAIKSVDGVQDVKADWSLPEPTLGDKTWGLIAVSVADVESDPRGPKRSLVTQAIYGEVVRLLEQIDGWYHVQIKNDNYLGWVRQEEIVSVTAKEAAAWESGPRVLVTSMVVSRPGMATVYAGTILPVLADEGDVYRVSTPTGEGKIAKQHVRYLPDGQVPKGTREDIVASAKQFVGIRYLWGGTSPKGLDCSGFVQRVYQMNGYLIPRDADQQYAYGMVIDKKDLRPGDAVYFSTISPGPSHTGLYLGDGLYIESGGKHGVRIHSFDPQSSLYDAYLDSRYIGARRLLLTE